VLYGSYKLQKILWYPSE